MVLDGLSDDDVARAMRTQQVQKTGGSDFLPCYQHKIVAISVLLRTEKSLKLWSLGNIDSKEQDLVARFFSGVEKHTPVLVSWNGGGFDLPVLHYRSLLHGVNSSKYWEHGENDTSFRYNSYLSRYHWAPYRYHGYIVRIQSPGQRHLLTRSQYCWVFQANRI